MNENITPNPPAAPAAPSIDLAKLVMPSPDAPNPGESTPGGAVDPNAPLAPGPDNGQAAPNEAPAPRLAEPPANPKDGQAYTDNYGRKQVFNNGNWEVTVRPQYFVDEVLTTDNEVLVEGGPRTFEEVQEAFRDHQNVQNLLKSTQAKSTQLGQTIKSLQPLAEGLRSLVGSDLDAQGNVTPGSKLESILNTISSEFGPAEAAKFMQLAKYNPGEFEDPVKAELEQFKAEKAQEDNRRVVDKAFSDMAKTRKIDEPTLKKVRDHWIAEYRRTGRVKTADDAYLSYMDKVGRNSRPAAPNIMPLPNIAGAPGVGGITPKPPDSIKEAAENVAKTIDMNKLLQH